MYYEGGNQWRGDSPVANDFIDVHVTLGARASLPNHQGEMVIQLTLVHLSGCLHDGVCKVGLKAVILLVHICTCFLQIAKCVNDSNLKDIEQVLKWLNRCMLHFSLAFSLSRHR